MGMVSQVVVALRWPLYRIWEWLNYEIKWLPRCGMIMYSI